MGDMPRFPFCLPGLRALAGIALVLGFAGEALAQGASPEAAPVATGPGSVVKETHGAWQVSCRTPPGAKEEKCALVQSVTAEDRPNVGLTVVFYKAIGEDKKLLRVVVPLGVLLPTGLGLKIDGQDVGNAPFLKCGKRGCVAEVVLQDEVIAKMKNGHDGHVHHLRHARGRHRHSRRAAGLRRRARQHEIAANPLGQKKSATEKGDSVADDIRLLGDGLTSLRAG